MDSTSVSGFSTLNESRAQLDDDETHDVNSCVAQPKDTHSFMVADGDDTGDDEDMSGERRDLICRCDTMIDDIAKASHYHKESLSKRNFAIKVRMMKAMGAKYGKLTKHMLALRNEISSFEITSQTRRRMTVCITNYRNLCEFDFFVPHTELSIEWMNLP